MLLFESVLFFSKPVIRKKISIWLLSQQQVFTDIVGFECSVCVSQQFRSTYLLSLQNVRWVVTIGFFGCIIISFLGLLCLDEHKVEYLLLSHFSKCSFSFSITICTNVYKQLVHIFSSGIKGVAFFIEGFLLESVCGVVLAFISFVTWCLLTGKIFLTANFINVLQWKT